MNLPFFRPRKEIREGPIEIKIVAPLAPTKLATNASIRQELVPPSPDRYEAKMLMECLVTAFVDGLFDVGFDLKILASIPEVKAKLMSRDFEMPDFAWEEINRLSCEEQARVVYAMIRAAHIWYALKLVDEAETLKGKEFLALPIELAGEKNFLSLLSEVKPMLPRLGLDKGRTQGEGCNVDYPTVLKVFFKTRTQFFRVYDLEDIESLAWFILELDTKLDYWPAKLTQAFNDSRTLLGAIEGVRRYYLYPDLHPELFRQNSRN